MGRWRVMRARAVTEMATALARFRYQTAANRALLAGERFGLVAANFLTDDEKREALSYA